MCADQKGGGLAHGGGVERGVRPPCPARQERGAHGGGLQHVAVAAAAGIEAGVEMRGDVVHAQHGHAFGQQAVGAAHPGLAGTLGGGVEMDDLGGGVHAGVGAAGGGYGNALASDAA